MSLEAKSLTELRGIAQAIGVPFKWHWDKPKLIVRIKAKTETPVEFPKSSEQVPFQYPRCVVLIDDIDSSLRPYKDSGMIVTYTQEAVRMTRHIGKVVKDDSCSLTAPLNVIMDCARRVME